MSALTDLVCGMQLVGVVRTTAVASRAEIERTHRDRPARLAISVRIAEHRLKRFAGSWWWLMARLPHWLARCLQRHV